MSTYNLTVEHPKFTVDVQKGDVNLTLSRTGGQGSKGDTITDVFVDGAGDIIFVVTDSLGNETQQINAGNLAAFVNLDVDGLTDVVITAIEEGDVIRYEAGVYRNHKLRTSSLSNFDEAGLTDGAVLVYNGTTSKYVATTTINNQNTTLLGGSF